MKKNKKEKTSVDSLSYTRQIKWNRQEKAFWEKYFNNPPAPEDIPVHVDHLSFRSCDISDAEIGFMVSRITSIGMLDLDDAFITKESIKHLTHVEKIQELRLKGCTELYNDCVPWLTQLKGLRLLHLVDTNIDIAGLIDMYPLTELEKLFISVNTNNDISAKMQELKAQLPNCNIYVNYTLYEF